MTKERGGAEPGVRARNRARMKAEILRLGRDQLADRGPAALSLREIARELGVASSAVYRYVADRDALLTLLVVDAYDDLADAVQAALASAEHGPDPQYEPASGLIDLGTLAHAMRTWALENPARWGLVYGTPVPGYAAPGEQTSPAGMRVIRMLIDIIRASRQPAAGCRPLELSHAYRERLAAGARDTGADASPEQIAVAVQVWSMIVGTISTEVFGQLGPEVGEVGAEIMDEAIGVLEKGLDLR